MLWLRGWGTDLRWVLGHTRITCTEPGAAWVSLLKTRLMCVSMTCDFKLMKEKHRAVASDSDMGRTCWPTSGHPPGAGRAKAGAAGLGAVSAGQDPVAASPTLRFACFYTGPRLCEAPVPAEGLEAGLGAPCCGGGGRTLGQKRREGSGGKPLDPCRSD